MVIEFARGQVQNFVAVRGFSLNFEDRNIPSVKIREGDTVQYDGQVALYTKSDGDVVKGRCMGLKSAINMMGWLELVVPESENPEETPESTEKGVLEEGNLFEDELAPPSVPVPEVVYQDPDYDGMKGGSFDAYVTKDSNIHVVGSKGTEVIKEEDLIVKELPAIRTKAAEKENKKLEVAGDQVEVKLVTSSTVTPRATPKRKYEVVEGEQYGADVAMPMRTKQAAATESKLSSFTVDASTPRATEGMSREEVQRITKPVVINADESQDAKVVKTFDKEIEVKEVEGITMRKTKSPKDITFKKTKSPDGFTVKTTVGSGSTGVADVSQQGAVVVGAVGGVKKTANALEPQEAVEVARIGEPKDEVPTTVTSPQVGPGEKVGTDLINDIFDEPVAKKPVTDLSDKRAQERAASRKKSSAQTQKMVEKEKPPEQPAEESTEKVASSDYLLMLPDNWGKMHWVTKEKFIKTQTDVAFITFIKSVEPTKAIQKACIERLKELEQTG